ncbi:MAG: ankyrin repeat domain-containing protein [Rickettsiales bacterium]
MSVGGGGRRPQDIFEAARRGDLEAVRQFIADGSGVNTVGNYGREVLHYAARYNPAAIPALLGAGADVNAAEPAGPGAEPAGAGAEPAAAAVDSDPAAAVGSDSAAGAEWEDPLLNAESDFPPLPRVEGEVGGQNVDDLVDDSGVMGHAHCCSCTIS